MKYIVAILLILAMDVMAAVEVKDVKVTVEEVSPPQPYYVKLCTDEGQCSRIRISRNCKSWVSGAQVGDRVPAELHQIEHSYGKNNFRIKVNKRYFCP